MQVIYWQGFLRRSRVQLEMSKRGQGTTFWIIITAVIALVVLVILLMIFAGKTGMLEKGLMSCEGKGGFCVDCTPNNCGEMCKERCLGEGYGDCSYNSVFSCKVEGQGCCLGVKKTD